MLITFGLTVLAWIFFRANNLTHAFNYIAEIFSVSLFTVPQFQGMPKAGVVMFMTAVFLMIEWVGREHQYAIAHLGLTWKRPYRLALYYTMVLAIVLFSGEEQQFIYFQF